MWEMFCRDALHGARRGFWVTGVMLFMFTTESLKQYAVLKAMGATSKLLLAMILRAVGVVRAYRKRAWGSDCAQS